MAETQKQARAFDYYYALGDSRTYQAVADQFNLSLTSIKKYARENNWKERVKERDAKNNAAMFEATDKKVVDELVTHRKLINASIGEYIKNLKGGKIKINSTSDLVKLIELDIKIKQLQDQSIIDDDNTLEMLISFADEELAGVE